MKVCAVVLAAGRGQRFGADKVRESIAGVPMWRRSADALLACDAVSGWGLVCAAENLAEMRAWATDALFVVEGGEDRQASSRIGCEATPEDCHAILIHDAARPFVSPSLVGRVIEAVAAKGAAAPVVDVIDTIRTRGGEVVQREGLMAMQTPQGARRDWLIDAHRRATRSYTDDAALLQAAGYGLAWVPGERANVKVTHPEDLGGMHMETRTGLGYDVHRFTDDPDRQLVLGGVPFPGARGLEGHSDADVLIHAAVDALLGAAALGDIGVHFPNSDPRWKRAPSGLFLEHAAKLLAENGWTVANIDIAMVAESPKIMSRSDEIRLSLATTLRIDAGRISVKATTNERLGSIGRGEGIAAFAVATIVRAQGVSPWKFSFEMPKAT